MTFTFNFDIENNSSPSADEVQDSSQSMESTMSHTDNEKRNIIPFHWLDVKSESRIEDARKRIQNFSIVLEWKNGRKDILDIDKDERLLRVNMTAHPDQTPMYRKLEQCQTDLIPGTYEGGLKIWECSLDLCQFLWKWKDEIQSLTSILELGCGHGLPGCLVLRMALQQQELQRRQQTIPFHVIFADFNDFVLSDVTLPNVLLNTTEWDWKQVLSTVSFGAGDWLELSERFMDIRMQQNNNTSQDSSGMDKTVLFDLILASETTYTEKSCQETVYLLAKHLTVTGGWGLVATKRYYFGCGGGSNAFRQALAAVPDRIENQRTYQLEGTVVESYDNGTGNIRDLWKIGFKERFKR
jgi:hypothetical protein